MARFTVVGCISALLLMTSGNAVGDSIDDAFGKKENRDASISGPGGWSYSVIEDKFNDRPQFIISKNQKTRGKSTSIFIKCESTGRVYVGVITTGYLNNGDESIVSYRFDKNPTVERVSGWTGDGRVAYNMRPSTGFLRQIRKSNEFAFRALSYDYDAEYAFISLSGSSAALDWLEPNCAKNRGEEVQASQSIAVQQKSDRSDPDSSNIKGHNNENTARNLSVNKKTNNTEDIPVKYQVVQCRIGDNPPIAITRLQCATVNGAPQ